METNATVFPAAQKKKKSLAWEEETIPGQSAAASSAKQDASAQAGRSRRSRPLRALLAPRGRGPVGGVGPGEGVNGPP